MGEYHWKSKSAKSCGVDDMVLLTKIEVSAINDNLQKRLKEDMIYTYIGPVLIAVNPFKQLPYFTEKELEQYQNSTSYENPPHIYCLCDAAFRGLITDCDSQCVIISGESGAGKTVSAKHVMNYITKVAGGDSNVQRVKDIILQSNPLLEAFGNAKTLRNDNSSRFGKYVEILFEGGGIPTGGKTSNFLLEKSRMCKQNKGERNFHIFYQLLSGLDSRKKAELNLTSAESYHFLNQSDCYTVPSIDDLKEFEDVKTSMDTVGLSRDIQETIFSLLAGLLHLGNVTFEEQKNQANPKNMDTLQIAAKLLKVDVEELKQVLISRNMESKWGGKVEKIKVEHNKEQAVFALEALAKAVYSRVFSHLVEAINQAIDTTKYDRSIGILDIYGFEIFDKNGFEQFCINYVNEKLQQIFIELTLKVEQEEYVSEGINWTPISYFNNKIVCDLIELPSGPPGIIAVMDDVCATMHAKGEGADAKLIDDMGKLFSGHNHFFTSGAGFIIKHYAGRVTYDIAGFCERNRDVLFNDAIELMKRSGWKFLASLFPDDTSAEKRGRPTTAGCKIRTQANTLVEKLMKCQPHYIRCIKPNETKKPYDYDVARVKHQIEYQGLKENIRIKRAGFAFRCPFKKFLTRFAILTTETYPSWRGDEREGIKLIIESAELEQKEWQLGKTKVFIKNPESLFLLEEIRDRKFDGHARVIQKYWRRTHNQNVYDREKVLAAEMFVNKKERYHATINRKFFGNYFNFDDQPILLTFIEKKEVVSFSTVVTKYDRLFRTTKRDLIVTQKHIYLIGREKVNKGPQKGRVIDVVKRKLPLSQIRHLQLSKYQDDFVAVHIKEDYTSLIETVLKTEFVYVVSKFYKKATGNNLQIQFTDTLDVFLKKKGLKMKSTLVVSYKIDPQLPNNLRCLKASLGKMLVTIRPGRDASSMPEVGAGRQSSRPPMRNQSTTAAPTRNQAPILKPSKKPPPPPPKKGVNCYTAQWDFQGGGEGELSFKEGDTINVTNQEDAGWWEGELKGKKGLFPSNYVEKLD